MRAATPALRTHALIREFRGFRAVDGVDLTVAEHSIHALVGPNGAGKTTLFNLLTGFLKPNSGRIEVFGRDVTGLAPQRIAHVGVARSFQITSLFDQLTLCEHVELALQGRSGGGLRFWRSDRALDVHHDRVDEVLDQVGLLDLASVRAGALSYGRKRALELALVLALDPRLLLLDEPTSGMDAEDVDSTIALVRRVSKGRSVVFVDHNMHVVGSLADRVTVLQQGQIIAEGTYQEVRRNPQVVIAYLGAEGKVEDLDHAGERATEGENHAR